MSHRQQPKPEHKATTFYIMFKAELAANAKTGPASDMDKETIMNLAPQAACDVLKVVFKVEVTVKSIKEYYDQIKDNVRIAGITWDRDAAGEIIIGQVQDEPVFNRIISCLDKYRNVSPNSSSLIPSIYIG